MSDLTLKQIPVGDLHCQRDTYARTLTTECIACSEKPDKKGFYQVKLYDTILFPEGGGQPADTGLIDGIKVYDVQRQKLAHVHYTKEPVTVGKQVKVELDWNRRWDHIQQHSGQHLLSAVLEQEPFNIETLSWSLGEKRSFIELPTAGTKIVITQELLNNVEHIVNQKIVENIPVITHSQPNTDDTERPDSLPDDYMGGGIIRTIEIEGLDKNPCCGTHIRGLGQLQALKLLHTEKVRGGNTRVFFLFGQRVLDTLDANYAVARQLTSILSGGPETFVENVTKIQQQSKEHLKKAKRLLAALAGYAVKDIEVSLKETDCAFMYDEEADMEFVTMVAAIMKDRKVLDGTGKVVVLVAGPKKTGGPIIIAGDTDDVVQKTGKVVKETIPEVKGGGKGRWMGKSSSWSNIDALKQALEA